VSLKSTQLIPILRYEFTFILTAPVCIIVPHSHKEGFSDAQFCTDTNQIIYVCKILLDTNA